MEYSTLWWLAAGVAVAAELLSGTFYLLMLALGMAGAGLAANLGAPVQNQVLVAAVVGGGAVALWHQYKRQRPQEPSAQANPDVFMDIGETVTIAAWAADGTAHVQYRGADWTAVHRPGVTPTTGAHRVVELTGSRLVVEKS
jgi:membrane protein implicated in regulation of membrane protease activity